MNYYNENDRGKAAWLRELIARNLISPGEVDERSIVDVRPRDLRGFAQCHFFAGIGIWSYALRLAGWPDDRPVWTASCPCQPFSAAGKRKGTADQRHLWPEVARLVAGVRPVVLIGEQVARRDGLAWFDDVCNDLERCDYTVGANVAPACGFGSPHIRERLYWLAIASGAGLAERGDWPEPARAQCATVERGGDSGGLADLSGAGCEAEWAARKLVGVHVDTGGAAGGLEHGDRERCALGLQRDGEPEPGSEASRRVDAGGLGEAMRVGEPESGGCGERGSADLAGGGRHPDGPSAVNGFWAGADWVLTRSQRLGDPFSLRPVEPGSFPLVDGAPKRVGRLRGYGDGIVAPQAAAFIEVVMEIMSEEP